MSKKDDAWFTKHFPTSKAREAADKAIDNIDPKEPMTTFLDAWIAAYKAAGGKTKIVP